MSQKNLTSTSTQIKNKCGDQGQTGEIKESETCGESCPLPSVSQKNLKSISVRMTNKCDGNWQTGEITGFETSDKSGPLPIGGILEELIYAFESGNLKNIPRIHVLYNAQEVDTLNYQSDMCTLRLTKNALRPDISDYKLNVRSIAYYTDNFISICLNFFAIKPVAPS